MRVPAREGLATRSGRVAPLEHELITAPTTLVYETIPEARSSQRARAPAAKMVLVVIRESVGILSRSDGVPDALAICNANRTRTLRTSRRPS